MAVRLHRVTLPGSICRADGQLLVCQHAYDIPAGKSPVLRLRQAGGDLVGEYLDSFERVWDAARPPE